MPRKAKSNEDSTSEEIEATILKGGGSRGQKPSDTARGAFWVNSGSDLMDLVVGGGRGLGYETGMSVLFEASSSAGKSFLAHEVIASAYHKYKEKCKWLYLDVESGCTFDSKALYGIEIMPANVGDRKRPTTLEDCHAEIMNFGETVKSGEFGIVVVDSLDGLMSEDTEERVSERARLYAKGKEYDKGSFGMQKAKYLSQEFFPSVNAMVEKKNILLILVSQYRESAGQYGPRNVISGGKALTFYTHARVKFQKKEEIEIKGRTLGAVISVETVKMKGPRPYRNCLITIFYTRGIDNVTSNVDYLYDLRTAERGELKKNAEEKELKWKDQVLTREALIRYIEEHNEEEELSAAVREKWEAEEIQAAKMLEGRKTRYA